MAKIDRRTFLIGGGAAVGASTVAGIGGLAVGHRLHSDTPVPRAAPAAPAKTPRLQPGDWVSVRDQFPLTHDWHHFSNFALAAPPAPVRAAIEQYRAQLDANPTEFLGPNEDLLDTRARKAAADYLAVAPNEVVLTHSTTQGLAIAIEGLRFRAGQDIVSTTHDHYAMYECLRLRTERDGVPVRRVTLYDRPEDAAAGPIVDRLMAGVGPKTRLVALTWVHSSTGVRLPIRQIADALVAVNASREVDDRVLLLVDGVHALGMSGQRVNELGCDIFSAGTHKWVFGPRGTGVLWARGIAWAAIRPLMPTFASIAHDRWLAGRPPDDVPPEVLAEPGGYHAFEHRWAVADTFGFLETVGHDTIAERTTTLNSRLATGLRNIGRVHVVTPSDPQLSAGLVCFEIEGVTPGETVDRLRADRVAATTTPYNPSFTRLGAGIYTLENDVDAAVAAIYRLASP